MLTKDRIAALFFLAFCLAYGLMSFQIRLLPFAASEAFTPRTMPQALAILGGIIAFLMLVLPGKGDQVAFRGWGGMAWGRIGLLGVAMLAYAATITVLGFILSTTFFLIAGYLILGERRWKVILGASLPVVIVFWFILARLLDIYLEPGIFRDLF